MLRVPVISAIGHERDSTLIDDVAAVACSTPTHAPEAVVPLDCGAARRELERGDRAPCAGPASAPSAGRTRHLVALARGPARALRRERLALNQKTREIRASSERGPRQRLTRQQRRVALVLERAAGRAAGPDASARTRRCAGAVVALRAHDPERTLERGYALAEDRDGEPVTSAEAAARRRRD